MIFCARKSPTVTWGIGIEHETYLQFEHATIVKGNELVQKFGRERYSLDYRENYKDGVLASLSNHIVPDDYYFVFQMMNSHCFDKLDVNYEHKTLYTKDAQSNPRFSGTTILNTIDSSTRIQDMCSAREKSVGFVFFDGDAIELITKRFENVSVQEVVEEFRHHKSEFLTTLNTGIFKETPLHYPEYNVGWNMFKTSPSILLFNNGTYHVHVTLSTPVEHSRIIDYESFTRRHVSAIYLLQWFEPFYISLLGSPDIFGCTTSQHVFAKGSMRNAISRYIGVGTYHESMGPHKILTYNLDEFKKLLTSEETWWRTRIERETAYSLPKSELGLDFNLHKLYQSGFEMRIFDAFPDTYLESVLASILVISEHAQHIPRVEWCTNNKMWNDMAYMSILQGCESSLSYEQAKTFCNLCSIRVRLQKRAYTYEELFFTILNVLLKKYRKRLPFVNVKRIEFPNFNRLQHIFHKRQLTPLSHIFKF